MEPTAEQQLLLNAALLQGEGALNSWCRWTDCPGRDTPDFGSFRLLPLVYRNLTQQGFAAVPQMERLKGIYRKSWYQNQLLFNRTMAAIRALHNAGISTMALKGLPLSVIYYRDDGIRPMSDIDIVVHEEDARESFRILEENGWLWNANGPRHLPDCFRSFRHALGMKHPSWGELDLHWRVLYVTCDRNAEGEFWRNSVPLELRGVNTRTLDATDQLVHACLHGASWNWLSPIRWIPDALYVLKGTESIDWNRVMRYSELPVGRLMLRDALAYLYSSMGAPIPLRVLSTYRSIKVGTGERLEYHVQTRPPLHTGWQGLAQRFEEMGATYSKAVRTAGGSLLNRYVFSFPIYLQYEWELEKRRDLIPFAFQWLRSWHRATFREKE